MPSEIEFYYNPMSRGRIAHWMLEEAGASYEVKHIDWKTNDHKSPEFLKINPMGKIPAIVHKGVVVTENAGICSYLADVYPEAGLAPTVTDPQRGAYYRWLFFVASCLEPAMLDKTHPRTKSPGAMQLGHGSTEDVVRTIESAIARGFLVGEKFSAADLYLAANLEWYLFAEVLENKPVYQEYVGRCHDRPGFRRFFDQVGGFH